MSVNIVSLKPIIILVAPQMGENIGATARAMKNFGLDELRLVAPRDGWPNEKAQSMSVGAIDIISSAKIYETLQEAVTDLEYIYATTATPRDINKDYILSRDLAISFPKNIKVGIMFGRENWGLNNEEISYANQILTIDTDINFSSLNIAHSVAIICYELFQGLKQKRLDLNNKPKQLATQAEVEYFYEHLFSELDVAGFFRVPEKKVQISSKIRNLFSRINKLSKSELQMLRGIVTVFTNNKNK